MKLKFYLRGLGIGVVVTALLMGYVNSRQKTATMTDEQIMARAEALGMVREDQVLLSVSGNVKEEIPVDSTKSVDIEVMKPSDTISKENTDVENDIEEDVEDALIAEPVERSGVNDTKDTNDVKATDTKPDDGTSIGNATVEEKKPVLGSSSVASLEIARGSGSDTVSKLLEKGGFVDSAEKFDRYLCDHNYDNKIVAGVHQIPMNADYETIAMIITTR